jgi:hypothetical protein
MFFLACVAIAHGQIDSGGGLVAVGEGMNHSSIGGAMATGGAALGLVEILYPPAPPLNPGADTNVNGLPDAWEVENFGVMGVEAAGDADGDGTTNMMEYLAGTNPRSGASVFRPTTHLEEGKLILTVPTVLGRNYRVWGTENLKNGWGTAPLDTIFGDGSTVEWEYVMSLSTRYFLRIEILIPTKNLNPEIPL